MENRKFNSCILFAIAVFFLCSFFAGAEDPNERAYFTPALSPKHTNKPLVKGWASKRVQENLNRGLVAVPKEDGSVYLGWRLLDMDDSKVAFNVYRSVGGPAVKLNKAPIASTTNFVDADAPRTGLITYWVRPVVKFLMLINYEIKPSEKIVCDPNTIYSKGCLSIAFQGNYTPSKIAVADLNGTESMISSLSSRAEALTPAAGLISEAQRISLRRI